MDWKLPALRSIAALLAGLGLTDRSVLADRAREIRVPTLVVGGAGSPAFLQQAVKSVAQALPDARALLLPGQNHDVSKAGKALTPVMTDFYGTPAP